MLGIVRRVEGHFARREVKFCKKWVTFFKKGVTFCKNEGDILQEGGLPFAKRGVTFYMIPHNAFAWLQLSEVLGRKAH